MNCRDKVPDDFKEVDERMSNFDHSIPEGAEEKLRGKKTFIGYAGWNFFGKVWHNGKRFRCQVMQFGCHVNTFSAGTLRQIMDRVSSFYGQA